MQGDVIGITGANAAVCVEYTYDAWGVCTITTDWSECGLAEINPYRYRGYYYDVDTGMYYLQSRYYDPVVGRFLNADDPGSTVATQQATDSNLYSYCQSEPVNDIDASGQISFKKVLSIFKKVVQYAKKIIDWLKNYVSKKLEFYIGLSPSDISEIAKSIKRSPHRVRQALQSLTERLSKIKKRIGKIALGINIAVVASSIAGLRISGMSYADIIAKSMVVCFFELIKWLADEGVKKLMKLIPAIGWLLGYGVGKLVGVVLNRIITSKYVKSVTRKYEKRISTKLKTYKTWNYFGAFIESMA